MAFGFGDQRSEPPKSTPATDGKAAQPKSGRGQSGSERSSTARAILVLAAAGAPVPEVLVDELVRAVLEDAVVAKAREVQAGGPHKLLRAVELAEMVGLMGERAGLPVRRAQFDTARPFI